MSHNLYFIRGERLFEQLFEMTYGELERNTLTFIPTTKKRQHAVAPVQVQSLELIPALPNGILEVRAQVMSNGNKYQPTVVFLNIEFQEEDSPENITFTAADGQEYHVLPIRLSQNDVKVRCDCLDFRWRFSMYNQKTDTLYGPGPELYQKKTNRPPNNPRGVPGLCKHLLRLSKELIASQVIIP